MKGLQDRYDKARDQANAKGTQLKELKRQLDAIMKATNAHVKQLTSFENQKEQIRNKRHSLFRTCRREDIEVPVTQGSLPEDVEPESEEQLALLLEEEDNIVIDYTILPKKARGLNKAQQEEAINLYQEKSKELAAQIENIAPNMKAIERLGDIEKRLEYTNTEFEVTKSTRGY